MKKISTAIVAALTCSAALGLMAPKAADATVYLQCSVTPAGSAGNGFDAGNNEWVCGTNQPSSNYSVYFMVTGLAPGTYSYSWSNTVYDGGYPSVTGCTTSTCSQNSYGGGRDHDELVQVVVTNLSTMAEETYYAYSFSPASCGGGTYFC